jgi:hypothetical protein
MMNDRHPDRQVPSPAGLCERCAHVQVILSSKGSRFYLCRMSSIDPRFPRYPAIPVLQCDGFAPTPSGDERQCYD